MQGDSAGQERHSEEEPALGWQTLQVVFMLSSWQAQQKQGLQELDQSFVPYDSILTHELAINTVKQTSPHSPLSIFYRAPIPTDATDPTVDLKALESKLSLASQHSSEVGMTVVP